MPSNLIKLILSFVLLVIGFNSLADVSSENKMNPKFVAITSIVEHPALDNVRKGVEDELKDNHYVIGKNLKLVFLSAQGSSANAAQIAKQFSANKPDVIVGIATPSSQALVATIKRIPIVFTAVTDPVAAKLVPHWQSSNTNVTGVSDKLSLTEQINLILQVVPNAKNIGYVYSPSEINSTIILKTLSSELKERGMKLIAVPAQRTSDISTAARSLKGKVDAIYTTTDNNVVSAYEALAKVANENKIPLIASDPDSVARGAVAALGISYYDLGRQAGKIVIRILNGENPGDIAIQIGNVKQLILNTKAAARQGITLSDEILKNATQIIDK